MKEQIIQTFEEEFSFIKDKFEIIDILSHNTPMERDVIRNLELPSKTYNIVWHPGVYVFIGNDTIYKVGVSMHNSRRRVMDHLEDKTGNNEHCIWDINNYSDKSILLFNVKDTNDKHWLLALEAFFEIRFNPLIPSRRIG